MIIRNFLVIKTAFLCFFAHEAIAQENVFEQSREAAIEEIVDARVSVGDVRNLVWGLSRAEVEAFEDDYERLGQHENKVVYSTMDSGQPADVTYYFTEDQLYRVDIVYKQQRTNPQNYLNDYIDLQEQYKTFFGEATEDNVRWSEDKYKNDMERWGLAVMMGSLRFHTIWDKPRSAIRLNFTGRRMKPRMYATFISKTVIPAEDVLSIVPKNQ